MCLLKNGLVPVEFLPFPLTVYPICLIHLIAIPWTSHLKPSKRNEILNLVNEFINNNKEIYEWSFWRSYLWFTCRNLSEKWAMLNTSLLASPIRKALWHDQPRSKVNWICWKNLTLRTRILTVNVWKIGHCKISNAFYENMHK